RALASIDGIPTRIVEAADLESARQVAGHNDIDLAIIDLNMPGMAGMHGLAALRVEFPTLVIVVASAQDDATTIRSVLACGVSGFIPKTEPRDVVLHAIRLVLAGGVYIPARALGDAATGHRTHAAHDGNASLTPRQLDVMGRLLRGRSNKLIARELGLTEGTVKIHVAAILRTLGASNRTEAVARAHEIGLGQC
ncbi:MAG: response regulator transcription factor, partial [Caldimonas sp.]